MKPSKPPLPIVAVSDAALAPIGESHPFAGIDNRLLNVAMRSLVERDLSIGQATRIVFENAQDDIAQSKPHTLESLTIMPPPPTNAREMIPRSLRALFDERSAKRDWEGAVLLVGSEERIPLLEQLWPDLTRDERPEMLAWSLSSADLPSRSHSFLVGALRDVMADGQRVFDCKAARKRFAALPKIVTIYRGTVESEKESGQFGISWTLRGERAVFFATNHHRFRNTSSAPIILSARIERDELAGMLTTRKEYEVLFVGKLDDYQVERPT